MSDIEKHFDKKYKLHKACASLDEINRDSQKLIWFVNGYAIASNGFIGVRAKLNDISTFDDEDIALMEGKCVSADTYRQLLGYKDIIVTKDGFVVRDDCRHNVYGFAPHEERIKAFGLHTVFDKYNEMQQGDGIDTVAFDMARLQELREAMGATQVILHIKQPDEVIYVQVTDPRNIDGIIMPIRAEKMQ